MPGPGVWIRPFRDGFRVYYREQQDGVLTGTRVFPTKSEAEKLADELRLQIDTKRRTIEDALEAYKRDMAASGRRPQTVKAVDLNLRRLLHGLMDSPVAALTPRRCEARYVELATSGKYQTGTHHVVLDYANAFGNWLAHRRRRWLKANPFIEVEKIGERADHRSECLRVDEARTFRDKALELAAAGDERAVAVLLALTCSLRPSEIVQIAAPDVDDNGAVLWVAGATLKTRNTRRPIEVADPAMRDALVRVAVAKAPTDRLFAHHRGWVRASAIEIATMAGVPTVNARILRRTFATLAARRGRSLDDLAFSMGHGADAQARTAQKHYIAPGAREAGAAGKVLRVLDGGARGQR